MRIGFGSCRRVAGPSIALFLTLLALGAVCIAQDIESHPYDGPESEMSPTERERIEAMKNAFRDPEHYKMLSDRLMEAIWKDNYLMEFEERHGRVVSQLILWGKQPNQGGEDAYIAEIFNRRADGSCYNIGKPLRIFANIYTRPVQADVEALRRSLTPGVATITSGELPPSDVLDQILPSSANLHLGYRSAYSPNRTIQQTLEAGVLGDTNINPQVATILNALPVNSQWAISKLELRRLGIGGTPQEWKSLDQTLRQQAANWDSYRRATKRAVLDELAHGKSNVVILFAHGSSQRLYLPGIAGGSISSNDLDRIKRTEAPHRIIVLFSCNASKLDTKQLPLAEQILKNRLAQTVFAADTEVDAQDIPAILQKLWTGDRLRDSLPMLKQIVQIEFATPAARQGEASESAD